MWVGMQVNGDVFLGRYMDNEEDFERMDFTTADLSSAAPWVSDAQRQIARRSERSGDAQALLQRLQQQQPAAAGSGSKAAANPADAAKAKGNEVRVRGSSSMMHCDSEFVSDALQDSACFAACLCQQKDALITCTCTSP
jgi:hypothetical protein